MSAVLMSHVNRSRIATIRAAGTIMGRSKSSRSSVKSGAADLGCWGIDCVAVVAIVTHLLMRGFGKCGQEAAFLFASVMGVSVRL